MSLLRGLFKNWTGTNAPTAGGGGGKPPEFNEDFSEFVNNEYTTRQTERRFFELQWRLNGEFLDGNQYLDINPKTMAIEEIPNLYFYQEREVFNQLGTIVETRVSKMSRQKPMLKTRPASSDDVDISSAKVTSMLLGSTWHDQLMDENYEDFVSWMELTGTVFYKPVWNKNKGRSMQIPQQMMQPQGQAPGPIDQQNIPANENANMKDPSMGGADQQQMITLHEGDIETTVVSSFEIYPDSSYRRNMREVRSIIHAKALHIAEVEETWGQLVEPEDVDVLTLQRTSTSMGGLGYGYGGVKTASTRLKNHVVVKEYYERSSKKYPQGRFIVVAGKKTLYAGPLPYQIGQNDEPDLPFIRCVSIDRPGCFWGKTVIERCIPIQRRYNAVRNRKAEYLNMVTIGQWKVPIGSTDEGTEFSNAPGNVIYYRPGIGNAGPELVQFPNLPSSFEVEEQTLLHEFTAISGVSELSRYADAPSGVKSGVALGIAKEQDDTKLASSVQRIANATIDLGQKWIRFYRQFVQEPRLLRFIGGNREADVREWERSDLRSDDVFIENMAALAETPSQRRQMVFDLLNSGLFARPELSTLDQEGRQKVFQLLEFGHWETGFEDDNFLQKSRARRENNQVMEGQQIQVMDFDDHMMHIQVHNRQRMQAEWEELLKTPNGVMMNEMMMAHIAEHIQLALAAMPKEPVQVGPADGKPGASGEKSPPKGGEKK